MPKNAIATLHSPNLRTTIRIVQRYRRNFLPGGTYFFTVNLLDRSSTLLIDEVATLRAAIRAARAELNFRIDAWVVLPEHMHCIWTLPQDDSDYPARWRIIKATFSRNTPGKEAVGASLADKHERGIWQRRYWEHTVRDERDYAVHMDYVHFNPVKHGLVERPRDWAFSTFGWWVARGMYAPDWGADPDLASAGERRR